MTEWVQIVRDVGGLGVALAALAVLHHELRRLREVVAELVGELRRGR